MKIYCKNMTTKERIEIWGIIILEVIGILGGMYAILAWSSWRDERLMLSAQLYEDCIAYQYKTTPYAYKAENGVYPTCEEMPEIIKETK
jgi:hypothetical protein